MQIRNWFFLVLCLCVTQSYRVNAQHSTAAEPVYIPPTSQEGWKVTSEDTRGAFSVEEIYLHPGTEPASYKESQEDRGFYILAGHYEFSIDDRIISASTGAFLFVPGGVLHSYKNAGTTVSRHLQYGVRVQQDKQDRVATSVPVFIPPTSQDGPLTEVGKNRKGGWKLTAGDTRGAFSIVETLVQPGMGPGPHRHSMEDEGFYVLEGQEEYRVGDRVISASAGSFIFAPRGIPHAYKNAGTTPSRHITIIAPAGFKRFLDERNALRKELSATDPAYPGRLKALTDKYGLEYNADWAFPPVAEE
ncbi:MAG: cupin domain-containing protein [Candidatus Latescibacteria bacterium]|nr:cupin domain-containing protein [Candidatus Latescibacterota bacterium]